MPDEQDVEDRKLQSIKKRNPFGTGKQQRETGRMSVTRRAWVTLKPFEIVYFVNDDTNWMEYKGKKFLVPRHKVEIRFPTGRKPFAFDLSSMTAKEVRALWAFWRYVLSRALKASEQLDDMAQEAFDQGEDTYVRLYRPDPILYAREQVDGKDKAVPLDTSSLESFEE